MAAKRKEKRAYEKQKRKEAQKLRAAEQKSEHDNDAGDDEGERDEAGQVDDNHRRKRPRIAEEGTLSKGGKGGRNTFKARVVVDLGFDELMSENVSFSFFHASPLET